MILESINLTIEKLQILLCVPLPVKSDLLLILLVFSMVVLGRKRGRQSRCRQWCIGATAVCYILVKVIFFCWDKKTRQWVRDAGFCILFLLLFNVILHISLLFLGTCTFPLTKDYYAIKKGVGEERLPGRLFDFGEEDDKKN